MISNKCTVRKKYLPHFKLSPVWCNELKQVVMVALSSLMANPFFRGSITIMPWIAVYRVFTVNIFKADESVIATQRAFRAHFMLRRMMQFQIEDRYRLRLKMKEPQVYQLKESH